MLPECVVENSFLRQNRVRRSPVTLGTTCDASIPKTAPSVTIYHTIPRAMSLDLVLPAWLTRHSAL